MKIITFLVWTIAVVWMILLSTACSSVVRPCKIPVLVAASTSLAPDERAEVEATALYWNELLDAPAFMYMGEVDMPASRELGRAMYVIGRPDEYEAGGNAAITSLEWDEVTGCIAGQMTELYYEAEPRDPAWSLSILRHEFAHALGAYIDGHRIRPGHLMSRGIGWAPPGGRQADAEEVDEVRSLLPGIYRKREEEG